MTEMKGPLLQKPAGASDRRWGTSGTESAVSCEVCGTDWPETADGEGYTLSHLFGLQLVEECCGKLLDNLYEGFGEPFSMAFLERFAEDPLAPGFNFLRFCLPSILQGAHQKAEVLIVELRSPEAAASALKGMSSR